MSAFYKSYNARINSDLDEMGELVGDALNFIREEYRVDNKTHLFEIRVILSELVLNGIRHGNKEDRNKDVKLSLTSSPGDCIYITVEDEGPGYDYNYIIKHCKCCESMFELYDAKETGRGILIVNSLSERLIFNTKGNKITAVKRI